MKRPGVNVGRKPQQVGAACGTNLTLQITAPASAPLAASRRSDLMLVALSFPSLHLPRESSSMPTASPLLAGRHSCSLLVHLLSDHKDTGLREHFGSAARDVSPAAVFD